MRQLIIIRQLYLESKAGLEEREHIGQMLCEDCYMDVLSPAKSCDPWAVHSAKSFERHSGSPVTLTPIQTEIMGILKERREDFSQDLVVSNL